MNEYCIDSSNAYLQGTSRSEKYRDEKDYAYIIYEVMKCQDISRNQTRIQGCQGSDCEVDPPCADDADINNWLSRKKISFTVIDN